MARSASAVMVRLGLTPRFAPNTDPTDVHIGVAEDAMVVVDHAAVGRSGNDATSDAVPCPEHRTIFLESYSWRCPGRSARLSGQTR